MQWSRISAGTDGEHVVPYLEMDQHTPNDCKCSPYPRCSCAVNGQCGGCPLGTVVWIHREAN